jgi:hypothetical protein
MSPPAPRQCTGLQPPQSTCVDGTWAIYIPDVPIDTELSDNVIVLATNGSGLLIVAGENTTVVLDGTVVQVNVQSYGSGSSLINAPSGCLNLTGAQLTVTLYQSPQTGDELNLVNASCLILATNGLNYNLDTSALGNSDSNAQACEQISTEETQRNPGQLSLLFTVDRSTCDNNGVNAIAIGASVGAIGGAILIVIVLVLTIPALRHKVFPFLNRRVQMAHTMASPPQHEE